MTETNFLQTEKHCVGCHQNYSGTHSVCTSSTTSFCSKCDDFAHGQTPITIYPPARLLDKKYYNFCSNCGYKFDILSVLKAVEKWAGENMLPGSEINYEETNKASGYNDALSDLLSFLKEAREEISKII